MLAPVNSDGLIVWAGLKGIVLVALSKRLAQAVLAKGGPGAP